MINAAFWSLWLIIAAVLATGCAQGKIPSASDLQDILTQIGAVDGQGHALTLASAGKNLRLTAYGVAWLELVLDLAILVPMHRMIHLCAYHEVWLARTMRNLTYLAVALVLPSLFGIVAVNVGNLYFHLSTPTAHYMPTLNFDPLDIAASLFVLVLRLIMKQAVKMHREQELTV